MFSPAMPELPALSAALASRQTLALPAVPVHGGSKRQPRYLPAQMLTSFPADVTLLQNHALAPDGTILPSSSGAKAAAHKIIPLPAFNLPAGAFTASLLTKASWAAGYPGFRFGGPALVPNRASLLERLGLLQDYVTLAAPTSFAVIADFSAAHFPPATIKDVAFLLRDGAAKTGSRVAILPQHASETFALANRASVSAWLRAKRVALLDPDAMPFDELAHALAEAALVILADPAQTGLLALCRPGTKILEISPEGWLGGAGRYLSALFTLDWVPCLAGPPTYKLLSALPFGTRVPLAYEIPIGDLAKFLQTLN